MQINASTLDSTFRGFNTLFTRAKMQAESLLFWNKLAMPVTSTGESETYAEIEKLAGVCKFRDYGHETEPGCAVTARGKLVASQGKTGQHIRDNEFLMSIRGRTIIPGGACEFDLPSYYAWQKRPADQRYNDIMNWFAPLSPLFDALALVLRLLRDSGGAVKMIAVSGSYQQMLQGKVYQMLRLTLDEAMGAIP